MNDLNAPLAPKSKRPPKKLPQEPAGKTPSQSGRAIITLGLAALIATNVVIWSSVNRDVGQAQITLPEPIETATITDSDVEIIDGTGDSGADVDIVYGTDIEQTAALDDSSVVDVPAPAQRPERRLSEGGPKIITVRDPSAVGVGQPIQIAHLPDEQALEQSDNGALPVRASDGRRPMDIYARPWSSVGGKRIALVIGGLGLSQTGTQRAIQSLPPEITLAFASSGNSLTRWMKEARKKGHELLVQIPMEPFGYPETDPGPRTLRLASSAETNLENLHWALGRMTNYTGIMNYLGGRLATDENAMAPILGDLAYRGLLMLNDGTASSRLGDFARTRGVPYGQADLVIDASRTKGEILAELQRLEEIAKSRGYAVGTGSALELTVDTVSQWANEAKKRGFEIVGVSAIVQNAQR